MSSLITGELIERFREARIAWATRPSIREAAAQMGWNERLYCQRYIESNISPLSWTSNNVADDVNEDEAFDRAAIAEEGR